MSTPNINVLADIPGLGPVRRAALAEAGIHDLQGLLSMKLAELAAVRGVGVWQARKIWEFLRQQGLLIEDAEGAGSVAVIAAPRTREEAEAVSEAIASMEAQSAEEARVEAEVATLADALQEAVLREECQRRNGADGQRPAALEDEEESMLTQAGANQETADEGGSAEEEDPRTREAREQLEAQREQLPDSALALIEAIRQAAVTRQLTRQVTRLLIVAGEFTSDSSAALTAEQRRKAGSLLAEVDLVLQRAVQKQSFTPREQKGLASRIRKRRKELEQLLER